MQLNLKAALESLLRFGKRPEKDLSLPVSMVLLLREPRFPTLDQLRSAAERAFGTPFGGDKVSRHCVVQAALFTLMKAGPHTLSFMYYTKPYGEGEFWDDFARTLPLESQRRAWAQHKAWIAVDYVKGGLDLELEYAVLAKLCLEVVDSSCPAVYVPREQMLIPNDGSVTRELQPIASARHLNVA